jgi:hypothetical protein
MAGCDVRDAGVRYALACRDLIKELLDFRNDKLKHIGHQHIGHGLEVDA